jgi:hypothetical protein
MKTHAWFDQRSQNHFILATDGITHVMICTTDLSLLTDDVLDGISARLSQLCG